MKLTRDLIFVAAGAVCETLAESPRGEAPEGIVYLALATAGYDLEGFNRVVELLVVSKLVTRTAGPCIQITDQGRKLVADMAQIRTAKR